MNRGKICKSILLSFCICTSLILPSCSINPATGEQQFTGLMSPQQEVAVGASEHQQIIKEYGGIYNHPGLQAYVNDIGQKLARGSDRRDVQYHFTLLNSPVVNAFALPGGYIYITRGILAVANSEDELAGVIAHEIGHVAARHQAARYSQGVLASLGAVVLSAAIGSEGINEALSIGTNLYMSSYSREQENEADKLGVRYLSRAGYDTMGVSRFLANMENYLNVEVKAAHKPASEFSYFSSHPDTGERVQAAAIEAGRYPPCNCVASARYLPMLRGMIYGDDGTQGFVRGQQFYHPDLDMTFYIPRQYDVDNAPDKLVASGQDGTVVMLDIAGKHGQTTARDYLERVWLKGQPLAGRVETIDVNGKVAATLSVSGKYKGKVVDVRMVAIEWGPEQVIRLQMIIPARAMAAGIEDLKRMTYSFRHMTPFERKTVRPYSLQIITAKSSDTIGSLSGQMNVETMTTERFMALNGLTPSSRITSGQMYKVVK